MKAAGPRSHDSLDAQFFGGSSLETRENETVGLGIPLDTGPEGPTNQNNDSFLSYSSSTYCLLDEVISHFSY